MKLFLSIVVPLGDFITAVYSSSTVCGGVGGGTSSVCRGIGGISSSPFGSQTFGFFLIAIYRSSIVWGEDVSCLYG